MIYSRDELSALAEICVKHDLYIISDEIYYRLCYDGRSFTSLATLGEAVKRRLPVFGICRGMQLVNVFFGGTLYQDIPAEHEPEGGAAPCRHRFGRYGDDGTIPPAHEVAVEPGSRLHAVTGAERLAVNSHHHQAVKRLAPGFRVSARATDGVVEAIEGDSYPAAGVQFHPEALVVGRPADSRYRLQAIAGILKRIGELCGAPSP